MREFGLPVTVDDDDDESTERSVDVEAVDMFDTTLDEADGGPIDCTFAPRLGTGFVRAGDGAAIAVMDRGGWFFARCLSAAILSRSAERAPLARLFVDAANVERDVAFGL